MTIINVIDLPQSTKDAFEALELDDIVAGLNAKAVRVAPCLASATVTPEQLAEAKLLLRGTLKRWAEAGAGALTQHSQTAGPFTNSESYDTRQRTGYNLWPSEITELQSLCNGQARSGRAFEVDTMPASAGVDGVHGVDYWWSSPDTKTVL